MKKLFTTPPEILEIQRLGYICLQMKPLRWRIRGETGFIDVWPHAKKVVRHPQLYLMYERHPYIEDYTDLKELVQALVLPWPADKTLEQQDAFHLWRSMLDEVLGRLSTYAGCT